MEGPQIVTAWKHWLESDEGKSTSNPFTLPPGENARQYLKNRLERAFQAGIRAAERRDRSRKLSNVKEKQVEPIPQNRNAL
jgi:hypothetical protein